MVDDEDPKMIIDSVLVDVSIERKRQNEKWGRVPGNWSVPNDRKLTVLTEEVGEVARALLDGGDEINEPELMCIDEAHLYEELVQVAAVAVAFAETIQGRYVDPKTR